MSLQQKQSSIKRRRNTEPLRSRLSKSRQNENPGSHWLPDSDILRRRMQEVFFILGMAASLFLLFALLSYHRSDAAWSSDTWSKTAAPAHIANIEGHAGAWLADVFLYLCGYMAYLIPAMGMYIFFLLLQQAKKQQEVELKLGSGLTYRILGIAALVFAGCGLMTLYYPAHLLPASAGGILGQVLGSGMATAFNAFGSSLILLAVLLVGFTLLTDCSLLIIIDIIGALVIRVAGILKYSRQVGESPRLVG